MQAIPAGYPIVELLCSSILYYLAFPNDRRSTNYLVYGIYVIEVVQTMFITHDVFATCGCGFVLLVPRTSAADFLLLVMKAVACFGQIFYAFKSSKSGIIPILVICVSLTSSVAALILGIHTFQAANVTEMNN
ncbi:hypothetical protein IW261DRAFT_1560506 [Armillaria novae-zelandiae]|uniref:Uncharacterized protein n=1 Tax=Armillaria novae-zelandiae TaxID=153914 RepID=A0AA39UFB0_9AGAR|nr:hypothetical protein IW261DRAFT_1560506 [Armillaria novae-zelandiae]